MWGWVGWVCEDEEQVDVGEGWRDGERDEGNDRWPMTPREGVRSVVGVRNVSTNQ